MNSDWMENKEDWTKVSQKLHLQFDHASFWKLSHLVRKIYKDNKEFQQIRDSFEKELKVICNTCKICSKLSKTPSRRVVEFLVAERFNEVVAMYVGEFNGKKFLVMVDHATNYVQAEWLCSKKPLVIIETIMSKWISVFRSPKAIMTDNGGEVVNEAMLTLSDIFDITSKKSPAESPWSNRKCEIFVGLLKESLRKLKEDTTAYREIALQWSRDCVVKCNL